MKKLIFFVLIIFSLSSVCLVNADAINHKREYYRYYKGNYSPEKLPKAIIKYLEKEYPDYEIIVSKKKNNGVYFIKIRFGGNMYRSYYRSLVFDYDGRVIKG